MFFVAIAYSYAFGFLSYRDPNASDVLIEVKEMRNVKENIASFRSNIAPIVRNFVEVANVKVRLS
jgi:hypothetical protein